MNQLQIRSLVRDYYNSNKNTVKKELEKQLLQCIQNPASLQMASEELTSACNEYEVFFFLSVFEKQKVWNQSIHGQKVFEYRGYLWSLLTSRQYESVPYLEKKLINIIVDDAKHSYPDQWPSLMDDLFNLQGISSRLALEALKAVIEEFCAGRGVGFKRGNELLEHINNQRLAFANFLLQCLACNLEASTPAGTTFSSPVGPSPTLSPDQVVPVSPDYSNAILSIEILIQLIHGVENEFKTYPPMIKAIMTFLTVNGNDEWNNTCAQFLVELFIKPGKMGEIDISPIGYYIQKVVNNILIKGMDGVEKLEKPLQIVENLVKNHFEVLKRQDQNGIEMILSSFFEYTLIHDDEPILRECIGVWEVLAEKSLGTHMNNILMEITIKMCERMKIDARLYSQPDVGCVILNYASTMSLIYPNEFAQLAIQTIDNHASKIELILQTGWSPSMIPIISEVSFGILCIGRMHVVFDRNFDQFFNSANFVVQKCLNLLKLLLDSQPLPEDCFFELSSNVFEALVMYGTWLRNYNDKSIQTPGLSESFINLIQSLTEVTTRVLVGFPSKHTILASRFLAKLSSQVRPNSYTPDQINQLISIPTSVNLELDTVSENTWNFAANLFLYPPANIQQNQNDWNIRAEQFQKFMDPLLHPISDFFRLDMTQVADQQQVQNDLIKSFKICRAVIAAAGEGTLQTRTVCFRGVYSVVPYLPLFLEVFKYDLEGKSLLVSLISTTVEILNKQVMTNPATESFIPNFVQTIQKAILDRNQYFPSMEEQYFKFLKMITDQHLCLDQMTQFIFELNSDLIQSPKFETLQEMLKLVDRMLLSNYTYFSDAKLASKQKQGSASRQDLFAALLQLVINFLNAQEPDIVRDNLITMQSLQTNYKFYQTVIIIKPSNSLKNL